MELRAHYRSLLQDWLLVSGKCVRDRHLRNSYLTLPGPLSAGWQCTVSRKRCACVGQEALPMTLSDRNISRGHQSTSQLSDVWTFCAIGLQRVNSCPIQGNCNS